ncbi:MAG: SUMF1/EgtB/PvdO family nonheme iron enzyme [Rhodothermales bacterium]
MQLYMLDQVSAVRIRIFISSPSDVREERGVLEDLIKNDLQATLGRQHNLYLEPMLWENMVRPGLGDIQKRVFEEMGPYDIFVGLFWKRFGTPTSDHESGSEAEFRDAYARWQEDNSRPVMMYFCERKLLVDVDTDPEDAMEQFRQAQKLKQFREELGGKGLYWTYTEFKEFERLVSRHLYDVILDLVRRQRPVVEVNPVVEASEALHSTDPLLLLPPLPEMDLPATPYRRLQYFRREDAGVFFGRGREIRALFEALTKRWSDPVALFYGESGVGKSSLLAAGVLPRLKATHEVRYERRDRDLGLTGTLKKALHGTTDLYESWHQLESRAQRPLIVILDQLEESFTRPMQEGPKSEIATFIAQITPLFADRDKRPRGKLLLSFRKEWYTDIEARLTEANLSFSKMYLERLGLQGIVEIVQGPASNERLRHKYNLTVEDNLAEMIAANLIKDQESPIAPTLSILLAKMWEAASAQGDANPAFTQTLYLELASQGLLLSDFLKEHLEVLKKWNTDVAQSGLLLDVLNHHTTALGTAEARTYGALIKRYPHRAEVLDQLLLECQSSSLLVGSQSQDLQHNAEAVTRLTHDTLAPLIRQQHKDSDRPGQRAERVLQSRMPDWRNGKSGPALDETGLTEVEQGLEGMRAWNEDEKRLIATSRNERWKRRMQQYAVYGASVIVLGVLGWVYQYSNRHNVCNESGTPGEWCRACIDYRGTWGAEREGEVASCQGAQFELPDTSADFVRISAGTFLMGSDSGDSDEQPPHQVTITKPYLMSEAEVTQAWWYAVMGDNPSYWKGAGLPVEQVSWNEIQVFLERLNTLEECVDCYRLPTEAEWEYAARAGTSTAYSFGDREEDLEKYAWYFQNSNTTQPVKTKLPNVWGLYDMHGNVWEWVEDWYGAYPDSIMVDPTGPDSGSGRVIRGGGWDDLARGVRSSYRPYIDPGDRHFALGFRLVRTVP